MRLIWDWARGHAPQRLAAPPTHATDEGLGNIEGSPGLDASVSSWATRPLTYTGLALLEGPRPPDREPFFLLVETGVASVWM